jgi:hypothetical protein
MVKNAVKVAGQAFSREEVLAGLVSLYRTTKDRSGLLDYVERQLGKTLARDLLRVVARRDNRC